MRIRIAESNRPRKTKQKSHTEKVSHEFVATSLAAKSVMKFKKNASEVDPFVPLVASCGIKRKEEEVSHKGTKSDR
ncbi:MAG: hypothetical protein JJT78_11060 [Leptospira sp.]|nr:hypothetical protein [Leptospira sp.]